MGDHELALKKRVGVSRKIFRNTTAQKKSSRTNWKPSSDDENNPKHRLKCVLGFQVSDFLCVCVFESLSLSLFCVVCVCVNRKREENWKRGKGEKSRRGSGRGGNGKLGRGIGFLWIVENFSGFFSLGVQMQIKYRVWVKLLWLKLDRYNFI